jgi:hypothetical protein
VRVALNSDVQPGSTPQFGGKPLPLMLTPDAARHGMFVLIREGLPNYQNKALHAWIARWIYQDVPIHESRGRERHRDHDQRFGVPVADSAGREQSFLIVGYTGSAKSSVIRQMLYRVESRGGNAHLSLSRQVPQLRQVPQPRRHFSDQMVPRIYASALDSASLSFHNDWPIACNE